MINNLNKFNLLVLAKIFSILASFQLIIVLFPSISTSLIIFTYTFFGLHFIDDNYKLSHIKLIKYFQLAMLLHFILMIIYIIYYILEFNNYTIIVECQPVEIKLEHSASIITRFCTGIKKGITTPNLPQEILVFQSKPIIRILRVIGGLSCISLLGHNYINLKGLYLYAATFLTIIFIIYHMYLNWFRWKHMKKILKSKDLDVRNSPFDRFASIISKAVFCAKGACETAQPVGMTLGLMIGFDEILKAAGRDAFFIPMLGAGLETVLPPTEKAKWKRFIEQGVQQAEEDNIKDKVIIKDDKGVNNDKGDDSPVIKSPLDSLERNLYDIIKDIKENWYSNLNKMQQLCFSLLILKGVILACLVNISLTLFGEYLINRFSLESRYPKLFKLIELRRKFKSYYLKFNILAIFIVVLVEMLFSIAVISL